MRAKILKFWIGWHKPLKFWKCKKMSQKSWWYLLKRLFYNQTQGFLWYLWTFLIEENKHLSTRSGYCLRKRSLHDKCHLLAKLRICDSENSSVHSYWVLWGNGIIPLQSYNLFVGPIIVSPVSPLLKALCMAASGTLECEWSLVDVWLLADRDDLSGDLKEVLVSVDSPPSEALHFRLKLSLGLISGTSSGPRLCTQNKKQKKLWAWNLQVIESTH